MTISELRASLKRARSRAKHYGLLAHKNRVLAHRRARQIKLTNSMHGPSAAIKYALQRVGVHEIPAGSNRGPRITKWQEYFGKFLVGQPWCGVFVGRMLTLAGVHVDARVASVALIEDDARARRNGWSQWLGKDFHAVQPGDAVILFGRGHHVGLVESVNRTTSTVRTIEGNTSPGNGGSQDNGGGVYRRTRSYQEVYGFARPAYS